MFRKFDCKNCNNLFEANDEEIVKCPLCQSDNVEYHKWHFPRKLLWTILVSVVSIIIIIIVVLLIGWFIRKSDSMPVNPHSGIDRDSTEQEMVDEANTNYINDGNTIAPSLTISEKEYNTDDDNYKCRVLVSYPPEQPWKVVISLRSGQVVAESDDGYFDQLPYSKDDGCYIVALVDRASGQLLCEERVCPDFPIMDIVKKPWKEGDLEKALKNKAPLVDTPYIANPHKVIVVNKPKGDTSPTKSLRDIQQLLDQCGLNAKVEKVEHDKMKKISTVKIKIDYPDDWMQETDEY